MANHYFVVLLPGYCMSTNVVLQTATGEISIVKTGISTSLCPCHPRHRCQAFSVDLLIQFVARFAKMFGSSLPQNCQLRHETCFSCYVIIMTI